MNWLTNFVRPKIRAFVTKQEVPENLWLKCPNCDGMLFRRDLTENQDVCNHCGHHLRMKPADRMAMLFDKGEFHQIELPPVPADPLKFRDTKRYTDRLKETHAKIGTTPPSDALMVAHGNMGGQRVIVAAFDFRFQGGSMGTAVGEGLHAAARLAVLQHAPLVVIPASGGARMQEGILSLMQMPRTVIAASKVKEAGLPYIVVFSDPTTGGVTASFAMIGDIHIAETGAQIGFAGTRVIEETIRETLPDGFQRAEYLRDHGMVDVVVHRHKLKETLVRILDLLCRHKAGGDVVPLHPEAKATASADPDETDPAPDGEATDAADAPAESPDDAADDPSDRPAGS